MPLTNASVVGTPQWKAMMAIVMNNESIAVNQHVSEQKFFISSRFYIVCLQQLPFANAGLPHCWCAGTR
jgi:hypothetical protein